MSYLICDSFDSLMSSCTERQHTAGVLCCICASDLSQDENWILWDRPGDGWAKTEWIETHNCDCVGYQSAAGTVVIHSSQSEESFDILRAMIGFFFQELMKRKLMFVFVCMELEPGHD